MLTGHSDSESKQYLFSAALIIIVDGITNKQQLSHCHRREKI